MIHALGVALSLWVSSTSIVFALYHITETFLYTLVIVITLLMTMSIK